ncbi:MAG: FliM/FliN family flagellar motor switch protein [Phycisphaerae bacterium]
MRKKIRTNPITLRMLMDAVRNAPTSVVEHPNTREFDWTEPTRFVGESMEALRDFVVKASRRISDLLSLLLDEVIQFDEPQMTQFYGAEARKLVAECTDYIMPIYIEQREVGVIILPGRTAIEWVQKLLGGGSNKQVEQRDLSHLESEILLECIDTVLTAINEFFAEAADEEVVRGESVRRKYEIAADKAETYVLIELPSKDPESEEAIMLLLPGEVLDIPAGLKTQVSTKKGGMSDEQKMAWHVNAMQLDGTAILGRADLPMRSVMSLQPGDVLLTDRRSNQPIPLMVEGISVMTGYPVRSEWNFGLLISALRGQEEPENLEELSQNCLPIGDKEDEGQFVSNRNAKSPSPHEDA